MKRILSVIMTAVLLFTSMPLMVLAAPENGFETNFKIDFCDLKWKDTAEVEHDTVLLEYQLKGNGIRGIQGAWVAIDLTQLIWVDREYDYASVNDYIGEGKSFVPGKGPARFAIIEDIYDIAECFYMLKEDVESDRNVIDSWSFGANNFNIVAVSADGNTLYLCPQPSQQYSVNYAEFTTVVSYRLAIRPGVTLTSDAVRYITETERDALNQSCVIAMNNGKSGFFYGSKDNYDTLDAPIITGNAGITGKPAESINVISAPSVSYTVSEQLVTVTDEVVCKVGYLLNGKYVTVEAKANGNGGYDFEAPDNVTEVVIVVAGDVSGDGEVDTDDKDVFEDLIFKTDELTAEQFLAADVNGDEEFNTADLVLIAKSQLGEGHPFHKELEW